MCSCDENHKSLHPGCLQMESPTIDGHVSGTRKQLCRSAGPGAVPSLTPPHTRGISVTKELNIFQPDSGAPGQGLLPFIFVLVFRDDSPLPSSYIISKAVFCHLMKCQILM